MSTDVKIAVIVVATLLLIVAVCAFDRWCARHLTVAERLAFPLFVVIVDDPTDETSPAGEEGEVEPVGSGLDLAADEAMALLQSRPGWREPGPDETPGQCEPELDHTPTLREDHVILYGLEYPHVCLPGCADRPTVYMGPVVLGRRGEAVR